MTLHSVRWRLDPALLLYLSLEKDTLKYAVPNKNDTTKGPIAATSATTDQERDVNVQHKVATRIKWTLATVTVCSSCCSDDSFVTSGSSSRTLQCAMRFHFVRKQNSSANGIVSSSWPPLCFSFVYLFYSSIGFHLNQSLS